ncbi:MAG: hypothetical protein M1272_02355 [Firmicutes bacterium]|nr:hypothetical protein [Bacillota bacterium]
MTNPTEIPRRARISWSQELIISAIQARAQRGQALTAQTMAVEDAPLLAAARRRFGSWKNALLAAGLPPVSGRAGSRRHGRGYWTRERILTEIREHARLGHPLHAHAMQQHCNQLVSAATYHFGSWAQALNHAGFNADDIRAVRRHSQETVIRDILALIEAQADLRDCNIRRHHRPLYWAAQKYFGSWRTALGTAEQESLVSTQRG